MKRIALAAALVLLAACDGGTEKSDSGLVTIRVRSDFEEEPLTSVAGPRASVAPGGPRRTSPALPAIRGSNGMLVIDHIFFVAQRLGLESSTGVCDDGLIEHPCTVQREPFLLWVPHGAPYELRRARVVRGEFDAFGFATDDLDSTGLPEADRARVDSLLADARLRAPGFPAQAVMGVRGYFSAPGGWREFTVYFRADATVTLPLERALSVPGGVRGDRVVDLRILPARWFRDGTVVQDLSQWDGQLVDMGERFDDGFQVDVVR